MVRLVIVVAIAIVLVIAGLIMIIEPFNGPDDDDDVTPPLPPQSKRISINAIPWARVFIRLPQGNNFIVSTTRTFHNTT